MVDVSKYRCMYIENSCVGKKNVGKCCVEKQISSKQKQALFFCSEKSVPFSIDIVYTVHALLNPASV